MANNLTSPSGALTHKSWSGPFWCGHHDSSLPSSMTSLKSTAIRRDAFDVFFPRWRHCQRHFKTLASHPVDERRHQHLIPADENVQALTLPSHPVRPLWTQKHQSVSKEARKMLFMAVALLTKSTPEARIAKLELFHTSPHFSTLLQHLPFPGRPMRPRRGCRCAVGIRALLGSSVLT